MADIAKITLKGESEAKNFIDEALRGDIAYEELSTTVSKTGGYVAGDHLIYLGQYYEVVADIAQGGTIVTSGAGQNVEEREVGDEIKKNKTQVLGVICDVETSPATAAHSAGDQFYYDGALVEATSAIAIGDTIVVSPDTGYNVKVADKVVAQMQTLTNKVKDMNNVLGAKNLLPNNAVTRTINGITFTVNSDGSVTANGTASAYVQFDLNSGIEYKEGKYALNGCPSGGGRSTYVIWVRNLAITVGVTDGGNGATLNVTNADTFKASIVVYSGATVNNLTFYPMIRPASITDDTYVPYSMTNREMTPYVQAISNPNLLDNPWFTVNQRGNSSYTGNGIYTFDRWKITQENTTISKDSSTGILTFSATATYSSLIQKFPLDYLEVGKKYTLSVMFSDGTIESHTFTTVNGNAPFVQWEHAPSFHTLITNEYLNQWQVYIFDDLSTAGTTDSVSFKAAKLELGSVSTLAMDTAPNYTTELLKCQRYFYKTLQFNDNGMNISPNQCLAVSATLLQGIKFPVQMRTNPSITVNKVNELGGSVTISGVAAQWNSEEGISYFSITGATVGSLYVVDFEASADL